MKLYIQYPSMSSLHVRRQITLQQPEDGANVFLREAGAHLPDYAVPQLTVLNMNI